MTRSTSTIAMVLLVAACGTADDLGNTNNPAATSTPVVGIPARALTEPGSAASLEGVLVRYYEPAGEGPGFDLRFRDDGAVEYQHVGFDPDAPSYISAVYDVDELLALIDGVEPTDLAVGADDCRPEVDGSAARLSLTAFEIDFCYTERSEHPLLQLASSERSRLAAALEERANIEPTDSSARFDPPDDFDGVLVRYSMPGGECDRCDFSVTFRADGDLLLRSSRGDHASLYDTEEIDGLLRDFEPARFATAPTDCGREVDGNAPILEVVDAVIDLCFWNSPPNDPMIEFVERELARIEAERDVAGYGDTIVARVGYVGGLCPTGVCRSDWTLFVDGSWIADSNDAITTGAYDPVPLLVAIGADHVSGPIVGPFTGTCPTAYDGAEVVYELIDPASGAVVFEGRTCSDEIDPDHPLIRAVDDAITAAQAQMDR